MTVLLIAGELFVHKNTLVYRLQKIIDLFELDLDNPYEREYLLFSFRCLNDMMGEKGNGAGG